MKQSTILRFPLAIALLIGACAAAAELQFIEVSEQRGLNTEPTWKYGGPAVADLNGDGHYDLLLSNHDKVPAQLFWGADGGRYREHDSPIMRWDVHGIAAGDYDRDGDQDVAVALGGGNGAAPQPPRILRNDNGTFRDITVGSGIENMGARGRSVRWIDMDLDGDLDLLQINAMMLPGEKGPRNILFENMGNDQFRYRQAPAFEQLEAERVLVTDFNGDHIDDLIAFSPVSLWAGTGDFVYRDVTDQWLPKDIDRDFVMAVAEADIDNDGDLDFYLARGKTYYQIANNALSFDPESGRLDLRDEGNRSHDGITLYSDGPLQLNEFFHWQRGQEITLPVYLGESGEKLATPAGPSLITVSPKDASGFPDEVLKNGWHLGVVEQHGTEKAVRGAYKWRLEWLLNGNLAWDVRASVHGVKQIAPDWTPQELGVADILLRNDGKRFTDISASLPPHSAENSWGVAAGDLDNNGYQDFFVYRFGKLRQRVEDLLLLNQDGQSFVQRTNHGGTLLGQPGHGDMGAVFDYDSDGDLDLLSGDDDPGRWHLFENALNPQQSKSRKNNYLQVRVGYSPEGTDPKGAEVFVNNRYHRVGSGSATHSQGQLDVAHFGLGQRDAPVDIHVRWRDGTEATLKGVAINQRVFVHGDNDRSQRAANTYPRSVDFNFGWKFRLEDDKAFRNPAYDDSQWRNLRLPHDWSIEHDFDPALNGATGYLPGGIGWYRKTFASPDYADGKVTYLNFDGIYNHSEIWLNGAKVGGRINGYTPFTLDITEHLAAPGEDNVLAVRVDRSRYIDSRWYTGSGIYRNVKLVTVDPLHIPMSGVFIQTPVISAEEAQVTVQVDVVNTAGAQRFVVDTEVVDAAGKRVAQASTKKSLSAKSDANVQLQLSVANPALWSPQAPNLYTAVTRIRHGDRIVDQVETRFGIRSLRFDADKGFFLNGVNTSIKGVNLHHDAGAVGVAVPKDVWRRRLETLKAAGTNAIRTAHNPASEEFLDLCDEMGFLVQAEIFDEWDNPKDKRLNQWERHSDYISRGYADYFQQEAESDLRLAVKRDRNHPSIIMWSIGNEIEWTYPRYKDATGYFDMNASGNYFYNPPFITEQEIKDRFHGSEEGEYVLAKTARKLSDWVKALDTSRPVTANLILPSVSHISGYTDALDIVGYSYRRVIYDYGHQRYPEKMIMGTENVVQWHEWKAVEERPFIPGTFLWTGTDYLGEANGAWPRKAVRSGMLDLAGFETPAYDLYRTLWNSEPYVAITSQTEDKSLYRRDTDGRVVEKTPGAWARRVWGWQDVNRHWNYGEGEQIIVEVLSNCPQVELSLNGESLGIRTLAESPDRQLKWALPFAGGRLTAQGVNGCDASASVETSGAPTAIALSFDRDALPVDNYSVAHVTAQLVDKMGRPVRHQDMIIAFDLAGGLELLGTDNGRTSRMTGYKNAQLRTSEGKALLIVRGLSEEATRADAPDTIHLDKAVNAKITGAIVEPS
ncbi:VCBS repeat-containing protein [Microbulbifer salipaludis]|uniref:VCBS repeat-containing protein n=1 Tax=Microbulbifer salipaludis TaxID=187980 RepID=A0ABS3E7C5_9GAMM|nr:glycoside hydrolase family 2 TIM barrel-domain containing protein [Microbulbifer salipaludis]MBN8430964.1 VCBS repeat-containing protein [Microbulbifer salipaludis]